MSRLHIASIILAPALAAAVLASAGRFEAPKTDVVPRAVTIAEGLAEDIQTDLDSSNWTMAQTRLAELQKNRARLRVLLHPPKTAGYEAAFDSLTAQVNRQDRPAALQSANHMSREIVRIMGNYNPTVPVEVGYLDVAGRDAIYAAETGRWEDAIAAAAELRVNYSAVQTTVASRKPTLDRLVSQHLTELDSAVTMQSAARIRATATRVLDDVDLIEGMF
jgi:hypothetical protein